MEGKKYSKENVDQTMQIMEPIIPAIQQLEEQYGVDLKGDIQVNYGGRDEVARATKRLAKDLAVGKIDAREINEETLPKYLDTYFLPDPDLVIRTSGEATLLKTPFDRQSVGCKR